MIDNEEYARLVAKVSALEALVAALLAERLATARTVARHSSIFDLAHRKVADESFEELDGDGLPPLVELARSNLDRLDSQAIQLAGITPQSSTV